MKYIALEEAFSIPGIADPMPQLSSRATSFADQWLRKLPDFTEYRLPEMDAAGIDIQVLSLTVAGLQTDIDADTARENARRANDYLAEVVSEHPTRFRGFMRPPTPAIGCSVHLRPTSAPTSSLPPAASFPRPP